MLHLPLHLLSLRYPHALLRGRWPGRRPPDAAHLAESGVLAPLARAGRLAWFGAGLAVGAAVWLLGEVALAGPPLAGGLGTPLPRPTPSPLRVQVDGGVTQPGVYELSPGARVEDALRAAGGVTERGDVGDLNLVARVNDGQRLSIRQHPPPSSSPLVAPATATTPRPFGTRPPRSTPTPRASLPTAERGPPQPEDAPPAELRADQQSAADPTTGEQSVGTLQPANPGEVGQAVGDPADSARPAASDAQASQTGGDPADAGRQAATDAQASPTVNPADAGPSASTQDGSAAGGRAQPRPTAPRRTPVRTRTPRPTRTPTAAPPPSERASNTAAGRAATLAPQPVATPAPEPASTPAAEPVAMPATAPVTRSRPQPVATSRSKPIATPVAEPADAAAEAIATLAAGPVGTLAAGAVATLPPAPAVTLTVAGPVATLVTEALVRLVVGPTDEPR